MGGGLSRTGDRANRRLVSRSIGRRLAGERGEQIATSMSFAEKNSWPFVARTWLVDHVISSQIKLGTDMVINLAAGLDTQSYRMNLPGSLQWIEVDLPEILAYKEDVLRNEAPVCQVERVRLDVSDVRARRDLFSELAVGQSSTRCQ